MSKKVPNRCMCRALTQSAAARAELAKLEGLLEVWVPRIILRKLKLNPDSAIQRNIALSLVKLELTQSVGSSGQEVPCMLSYHVFAPCISYHGMMYDIHGMICIL